MEPVPGDYSYNYTYPGMPNPTPTLDGHALFLCIISVIMTIIYIFISFAIVYDRKQYQKTFLLVLLNFVVSYTLMCIMRYFADIHIMVFPQTNKSICHTVNFLNSIIGEGGELAIFPIYIDLIVKYMMPERYEKRTYRIFILLLILVIWFLAIIKEIIYRTQTIIEVYCLESTPVGTLWAELAFAVLRVCATLIAAGFLVVIAIIKRPVSVVLGLVVAPFLTGIVLSISNIMSAIYQALTLSRSEIRLNGLITGNVYLRMYIPIIVAVIWLLHKDFRGSIKKLVTCSPCRKTGPQPTEHELTTDIA